MLRPTNERGRLGLRVVGDGCFVAGTEVLLVGGEEPLASGLWTVVWQWRPVLVGLGAGALLLALGGWVVQRRQPEDEGQAPAPR